MVPESGHGLVTTMGEEDDKHYFVKVESDNQEFSLNIVGNPWGRIKWIGVLKTRNRATSMKV